jgi:uncharacterized protein (TIGR02646 family)
MRPVNKGTSPQNYQQYGDAQPHLIERLGRYCSYCERKIPTGIAVEHKRPKTKYPREELNWDNFLLSCLNCNSAKQAKKIILSSYIWPDIDNTFRAFEYTEQGIIRVRRDISKKLRHKANRTLSLLGLDKHPGAHRKPTDRDYRWMDRRDQWNKAVQSKVQLEQYDTPGQRDIIVKFAQDGLFSVWMEVFREDQDMKIRLLQAFPGTAVDCFDAACKAIARAGGAL